MVELKDLVKLANMPGDVAQAIQDKLSSRFKSGGKPEAIKGLTQIVSKAKRSKAQ